MAFRRHTLSWVLENTKSIIRTREFQYTCLKFITKERNVWFICNCLSSLIHETAEIHRCQVWCLMSVIPGRGKPRQEGRPRVSWGYTARRSQKSVCVCTCVCSHIYFILCPKHRNRLSVVGINCFLHWLQAWFVLSLFLMFWKQVYCYIK